MNLTDAALQKFFLSKLVPLHDVVYPSVSINIDTQRDSYFEELFEPAAIVSQEDMVTSLIAIWERLGMTKMVMLEPDIREMAKTLRLPETTNQEISDFIYAMY
ncbi:hypothetical protein [Leptospira sp. GIMC2001]|uniref:hypothetical protein n=1 Tax=Leptospira sp. GIMC2001 TaxID=1513297 RepID=UPI00234B65F6|nr:hypothetical protein [Leptospira sp. GIMC2001]WCL51249.1 hypothetical protein O4O04_10695 [Leptospira sp. GIMC2001]